MPCSQAIVYEQLSKNNFHKMINKFKYIHLNLN